MHQGADLIKSLGKIHYGWIVVTLGILIVLSALGLARFGYTMILPSMQEVLGLTNTQAGALTTGNFVGYLIFALIGGFLAAHFSHRRVIAVGLLAALGFITLFFGIGQAAGPTVAGQISDLAESFAPAFIVAAAAAWFGALASILLRRPPVAIPQE